MSKEVKRYCLGEFAEPHTYPIGPGAHVLASDYESLEAERDALLAERDARLLQIDTLTEWYSNSLDVIREVTAALPGAYYMDPPYGGDVSVPEQVRRMAKDAERYRWLRDKAVDAEGVYPMVSLTDDTGDQVSNWLFGKAVDSAIDAALQGEQP